MKVNDLIRYLHSMDGNSEVDFPNNFANEQLLIIAKDILKMDMENPCECCFASPCADGERLNLSNCPLEKLQLLLGGLQ